MALSGGYQLSLKADNDLEEIFDHTVSEFGVDQAVRYLTELEHLFFRLSEYPELGKLRNEIKPELRSISKSAHVVFYRIMNDHIQIVRVLHGGRDITQFTE